MSNGQKRTLKEIETALAEGRIWHVAGYQTPYLVLRRGVTKRWTREPGRFEIPVKVGGRLLLHITSENYHTFIFETPEAHAIHFASPSTKPVQNLDDSLKGSKR